ncbi:hypothetical protein A9P82_12880 [Arachidicoccus ginsenosidimutans]|uniref:AAA domain-containing protein n=1 Tax=Arachidicoccus sp. BS20 TaxID=1850526 RepID=UPI0007F06DE5|nr:AAA domain-containing protein [Arachidicoccus sp. BS20]ANI90098.1 hypothetical protein A9P82_12880 [Arachidicoccus sp. BS20]
MSVLSQYITFLKEYKRLLERGIKDVLSTNVSSNFIWNNEIDSFIKAGICEATLTDIFTSNFKKQPLIFSLEKPFKPNINIPNKFVGIIEFDEAKNKFESISDDEEELQYFQNATEGKVEIEKLGNFKKNKEAYSKLYRAYNDIKNDSNLEIVLSVGFVQYSKLNNNGNLSKTNQHLFHFPLSLDIDSNNVVKISFSDIENPYADFFFLNNTPIEKEVLSNIIDRFEERITELGYEYIFENDFKELISKSIQKISSNSEFENSIYRPESDHFKEDYFKISFSPAINIKQRKPRFFEKLTDSIIKYSEENDVEAPLFNLLVRNPESLGNNSYTKSNYFKDELFETHKAKVKNLNGEEDFSVFFPLPFNKEQKQIYENYLENRLTVVTGPPGTGKSHTIVNILCSLLAQSKRVLVTAQTDKALESLLDKIPQTFDDLIFTKIQLETDQNRFSLEKSIGNISKILIDSFYLNVEDKIDELDNLKGEYIKLKSEIIQALEKEYTQLRINDSFRDLRAYQIIEKFESKDSKEWNWIQDFLNSDNLKEFDSLQKEIFRFKELQNINIKYSGTSDLDFADILKRLRDFNFSDFIDTSKKLEALYSSYNIADIQKEKILKINLDEIIEFGKKYSAADIVTTNITAIDKLLNIQINRKYANDDLISNKSFTDIIENGARYLSDIETYISFINDTKASFFNRLKSGFKQVAYLENITVNGKRCITINDFAQLKELIESLQIIHTNLLFLKKLGFDYYTDDKAYLSEKVEVLGKTINHAIRNRYILNEINHNKNFVAFSEFCNIDLYDITGITNSAIKFKEDFEKLKVYREAFENRIKELHQISTILEQSKIRDEIIDFIPVNRIVDKIEFDKLINKIAVIERQIADEQELYSLRKGLKANFPNTFDSLKSVPNHYISKENFEYAFANEFIKQNEFMDLQKCKEELSSINQKIFQVKCDILFDLAKSNFKNKFTEEEIDLFINLLNSYKFDYAQSLKKGIKDNAKFHFSVRKKGAEISKKLSCWVMKFNDVLNSLEHEPEIFDCIIVDEASQLNFNSVLLSYYSENMIIVGDNKQTSPDASMVESNAFNHIKQKFLETFLKEDIIQIRPDTSLFDLTKMVAGRSDLILKEHFRCVPEIIEFSKREFYDNSLRPLKQINSNRLNPKETFFVKDAFTEDKIVYKEIQEIKKFLQRILKDDQYANKSIGVVSLGTVNHTEKLKDIKEDLANEFGKEKIDKHKLIIEDSPKFQGDERDVMVVSFGVALDFQKLKENQNAKPRAIISSQDEFKKINVALSRAKEQMILFHSVKSEHLQSNDFRNRILTFFNDEVKPIQPLQIDDYNIERFRHNVPEPFDSWFEYDITKSLIENGYSYIQPQYSVKESELFYNHKIGKQVYINFKIDLVVHNNGKMIAIECDGDPFHSLPEDVAYDIERQEFLERVGWKVYRVLYSAFKRSPQEEIEKIIDFIENNTKKDYNNQLVLNKIVSDVTTETLNHIHSTDAGNTILRVDNDMASIKNDELNTNDSLVSQSNYMELLSLNEGRSVSNNISISEASTKGNVIIRYFNLFENNTYKLQENSTSNCLFSIAILEKYKNGFLLQCYDDGHINKVYVRTLLEKRLEKIYLNGKNPEAKIIYMRLIEEDTVIGLKIRKGNDIVFKAHKTEKISSRELLHLQGYKVMYQEFDSVEYKILDKRIHENIKRLIFESFTASGKSVFNNYYENEWSIIKQFIPNLNE